MDPRPASPHPVGAPRQAQALRLASAGGDDIEELVEFHEEVGVDLGDRPCGYLFIARSEPELFSLRAPLTAQWQAELGAVREVTANDIRRVMPAVYDLDGAPGGGFLPYRKPR